ncbi:H(+)-transporting V1 sector ATPase subunit H [Saccharomycopsis crataegensis]|uniref:V-type proton ATPase subunit H n=1 Tax=Saccharomycopsis crataegensis TaxID=43959 RepID=A0AAV5QSK7_9ASCO|nr:H(+)-transporting V1 sector ATPase subunit H [Saccharomycopsis crataegensis]
MSIAPFTIESQYLDDSRNAIRQRVIPWFALIKSGLLTNDEANRLEFLGRVTTEKDFGKIIPEIDLYTTTAFSLLSKITRDDIIKYLLNLILDLMTNLKEFQESLLSLNDVDTSLPYQTFLNHLNSNDEDIKLLVINNLAVLYLLKPITTNENKDGLLKLFDVLFSELINSSNLNLQNISVQVLSELLTIKNHRNIFWLKNNKFIPPLINLLKNKKSSLQVQYLTLLSLWLLSFNDKISTELPMNYNNLIKILVNISKDSIKEKIVRLSISILVNFINGNGYEQERIKVIKILLLNDSLSIIKNLNDRKWADQELIEDLAKMLEILNENYEKLTSFDEYLLELDSGVMTWSPPHRSKEFWSNYASKFKDQNYKLFKQLIALLNKIITENTNNKNLTNDQEKNLNKILSVICNDICQIITYVPEALAVLSKLDDSKAKIMELMTSKDVNLRYEALKTTQVLVAHAI